MLKDLVSIIFPEVCTACGKALYSNENCICLVCEFKLPKTNYHLLKNNPVEKLFWGRCQIYSAACFYKFSKGGKVQRLIHELKYKGNTDVGITIGKWYGKELLKSEFFNSSEIIIPVPLHKLKQRKRGYNQSEYFATGLSESMKIKTNFNVLKRTIDTDSQTKKSRYKRWQNVDSIFIINNASELVGKHILLVDDVITTGSTLEACIHALQNIENVKISVVSIAMATGNTSI